MADVVVEAGRNRLYHADLGIPYDAPEPVIGHALTYTLHAHRAATDDGYQNMLPVSMPCHYRLVEVELLGDVGNLVVKWTVRAAISPRVDLIMVITADYVVKTVWANKRDDEHATLDRSKYDRVEYVGA